MWGIPIKKAPKGRRFTVTVRNVETRESTVKVVCAKKCKRPFIFIYV